MERRERPQKNPLPAHPSPIISPTAKHVGTGHGKPFRGPLSGPAFSRMRLICSYFNQLLPREQGREGKKRKENEPSALLKRFLISHTHSQAGALPDTTALISRPENWRVSHGWARAASGGLHSLLSHTLQWERPVWAGLGAINSCRC